MNMKRIFKFFPVALAAFALASCSSDDLNVTNSAGELLNVDGNLLVQVEGGDEGTMRSGFMTTINPASSMLRSSLFFSEGDQLKLYHEATSWKPEVWTASEFGQYKNADGAAGGDVAVFDNATATITDDEKAYGIFPATIGQFGNENRTSLKYDLSELQYIEYKAEAKDYNDGSVNVASASDATGNTKAYTAPFPLWGVKNAGAKVMTVKHLTGILRFDLANIDNSSMTAAQARYIVIKSVNKLTGELATATDVFNPTTIEAVNPDDLMTTAPKLVTQAPAGGDPTTNIAAVPTTAAGLAAAGAEDVIVVELTKDDPNHVMLFLPITAGNGETTPGTPDVTIYVSKIVTKGSTLALGSGAANQETKDGTAGSPDAIYQLTADLIEAENKAQLSGYKNLSAPEKQKVQAGVFYRINDDYSNQNTTAKTPWELAQGIIAADKKAYRDFEINFALPIEVKNEDTAPQNFYLDLSGENSSYGLAGYDLKHNVKVNLTLKKSGDVPAGKKAKLYIKTKSSSSKQMTLNITNDANAIDSIIFLKDELNSKVVLREATGTAQLPAIHVNKDNDDKLTLEAGTPALIVNSKVTVDNVSGQTVDNVVLAKDVEKINLLNGVVTNIKLANPAATTEVPYDAIDSDVTIYSEGKTNISNLYFANMPVETSGAFKYKLKFESKWTDDLTAEAFAKVYKRDGTVAYNNAIVTAAQLAKFSGTATSNVVLMGEFDLNGAEKTWPGTTTLTKSFLCGSYYSATGIKESAVIKNLKSATGLFAAITPAAAMAVRDITFSGTNEITGTVAVNTGIGLLAGTAGATGKTLTLNNIKVEDVTVSATGKSQNLGGLIGIANGDITLKKVNVKASVTGYANIGGIFGNIAAGTVNFAAVNKNDVDVTPTAASSYASDNAHNVVNATLTHNTIAGIDYSTNYATDGQFAGLITPGATVTVVKDALPAYTAATIREDALWWEYDTTSDLIKLPVVKMQTYFGFSGIVDSGTRHQPAASGAWVDVTFYGGPATANGAYSARTYKVSATTPATADTNYYLNYVQK